MKVPHQQVNNADAGQAKTYGESEQKRTLVDNRPAMVAQRRLAEIMSNSPHAKQLQTLANRINNSPQTLTQRHKIDAILSGGAPSLNEGVMPVVLAPVQRTGSMVEPGPPNLLTSGVDSIADMGMDKVQASNCSTGPAQLQIRGSTIQKAVKVGETTYGSADLETLIEELNKAIPREQMKALGGSINLLKKMLDKGEVKPFDSLQKVYDHLVGRRNIGLAADAAGRLREEAVGAAARDQDASANADLVGDKVRLKAGLVGQDPYLLHDDNSVVRLDINDGVFCGLVGGPAKAHSDAEVEKELQRLRALKKCCDPLPREAVVKYEGIPTPHPALFMKLVTGALEIGITTHVNGVKIDTDEDYNEVGEVRPSDGVFFMEL